MSSKVGLVKPNDHIVVVQMISDSLVVKVNPCPNTCCLRRVGPPEERVLLAVHLEGSLGQVWSRVWCAVAVADPFYHHLEAMLALAAAKARPLRHCRRLESRLCFCFMPIS